MPEDNLSLTVQAAVGRLVHVALQEGPGGEPLVVLAFRHDAIEVSAFAVPVSDLAAPLQAAAAAMGALAAPERPRIAVTGAGAPPGVLPFSAGKGRAG